MSQPSPFQMSAFQIGQRAPGQVTPPAPPVGNAILWICGPKGIKTKIAFISGTEPEKES